MAAQYKKRIIPTRMVYPNSVYPDLYDNNKNTTDIKGGTVSRVTSTELMMGDFTVPERQPYGDGKAIGAKLGLYINSITAGRTSPGIPGLKAYKVPVNIGNREGGKDSAGSLISLQNFAQISSYHTGDGTEMEIFDAEVEPVDEELEVVQDVVIKKTEPYLSRKDGYKYGKRFGKNRMLLDGIGSTKHFKKFGSTIDGEEVYLIKKKDGGIGKKSEWLSVKEKKDLLRFNREKWEDKDIGGGIVGNPSETARKKSIVKWFKEETITRTNTEQEVQRANTSNTFFDGVKEAQTFRLQETDGTIKKAAFGDVAFSSSKVGPSDGQSLHMHTVYPHRDSVISDVFYPSGRNENDGSEIPYNQNNQTIFVTKELPLPLHLTSARGKGNGSGDPASDIKPLMPTIQLCVNVESLAPIVERQLSAHGDGSETEALVDHEFRMNRSIVFTFAEEKPGTRDTLYSYIKRHAPNSESGVNTHSGLGTSAKSFMALGLVNNNGTIMPVELGRKFYANPGGTGSDPNFGYHDLTFRLDATRGEISIADQSGYRPTTNNKKSIDGVWANIEFQLHPDYSGAFYSISDPETGDIYAARSTGENIMRNIKNLSTSSTGQWAMNDTTNFPRFMTIWVNNYQAIKGTWNKFRNQYETGLKIGDAQSSTNNLRVVASRTETTGDGAAPADLKIFQGGNSLNSASYLLLGTGDKVDLVGGGTEVVVEKRTESKTSGFPVVNVNTSITSVVNNVICYDSSFDPDLQVTEPTTMETSMFIDSISLRNFGMQHSNATPTAANSVPSRIKIPKTFKASPPQYGISAAADIDNITEHTADFASYICLGFDNISDFEGSEKLLLMNGYSVNAADNEIFLGDDSKPNSDFSCLRVGYTSIEDYGRQGVVDSYSRSLDNVNPSQIPTESATFSNGDAIPLAKTNRGLIVGDRGFTTITCLSATQADYASTASNNKYILLYANTGTSASEERYLIWFDHDNNGVKPSGLFDTYNVEVDISSSIGNTAIATALRNAISGNSDFAAAFTVGGTGTQVTVRDKLTDSPKNPVQGSGYTGAEINTSTTELTVASGDDGTVHGFTQKGLIKWNFNKRITRMTGVELTHQSAAGGGLVKVNTLTAGTVTLQVNDYIQVNSANGSEQMRIKSIDTSPSNHDILDVEKDLNDVNVTHASGSTVDLVAMPEKRESIFTSARVINVLSKTKIVVDSSSLFLFDEDQEYLIYIYNDSHSAPTTGFPKTLRVINRNDREIEFDGQHGIPKDGKFKYLVSPKKYWLMMEIHNFTDSGLVDHPTLLKTDSTKSLNAALNATATTITLASGDGAAFEVNDIISIEDENIQILDVTGDVLTVIRGVFGTTAVTHRKFTPIFFTPRRYLPEKNYSSAVMISEKGNYGATFNETLYNDGANINNWDLDPFVKADDTAIDLKDYGFGDYEEEDQSGGHLAHLNLNLINDVSKYKELDISGVVTVDEVEAEDTFTVLISPDEPTDSFKINVDTESGTNKPYVTMIYEDELPTITDFALKPNDKDPFNIDFTWKCQDVDAWYGFLHVSPEGIKDQYHGAVFHLPLNDKIDFITGTDVIHDGVVNTSATQTSSDVGPVMAYNKNGDKLYLNTTDQYKTSVGQSQLSGSFIASPKYDVEGLAGNCLSFDGNDLLVLGRDGTNVLADTSATVEKEMSVSVHVNHASGVFSADRQFILYKGLNLENQAFSIHAERIGTSTTGKIIARVYSDGGSPGKFVQLSSSSTVQKDVPLNIILTFDANLVTGNVKLFINGKLEDQSGPVLTSHSASASGNTGWIHKTNICSEDSPLNIGARTDAVTTTSAEGWVGQIEEIVVYNTVIYPVDVKSGKFTFTKPLKDLIEDASGISQTYDAKLFVKDYHNIRGRKVSDVATTPTISYRKAAFRLDGGA